MPIYADCKFERGLNIIEQVFEMTFEMMSDDEWEAWKVVAWSLVGIPDLH